MAQTGEAGHVRHCTKTAARDGFSLVELLTVIAIIGVLLALMLPAVQAARESARRSQCGNHLKQLGLAMESHVNVFRRYPSDGWGHAWVGDPDRGTGKDQPGSWIYNLLPYLEQGALRETGRGMKPEQKRLVATNLIQVPLSIMVCPTQRHPGASPAAPWGVLYNAEWVPRIPKNDYAVNGGDCFAESAIWPGPLTLAQGDADQYPWTDLAQFTGICYQRSEIQPARVLDGLSQTYLIGEKNVSRLHYDTCDDEGYNQSMYVGQCLDLVRWVAEPPLQDADDTAEQRFGSAHGAGAQFVFCDDSVHMISYQIDAEVHRRLGNRRDGLPISTTQY